MPNLSNETRDQLQGYIVAGAALIAIIGAVVGLIASSVFGAAGGALGGTVFRQRTTGQRRLDSEDRMRVRIFALLLVFTASFLATSTPVSACTCEEPGPPAAEFAAADAVFAGRVLHVPPPPDGGYWSDELIAIPFEVSQVWKGPPGPLLQIVTERSEVSCGYEFREGREYLVYARLDAGRLRTSFCSRTAPLASADEDLAMLGQGEAPPLVEETPASDGERPDAAGERPLRNLSSLLSSARVEIAIGLLAVIGAAALVWAAWKQR